MLQITDDELICPYESRSLGDLCKDFSAGTLKFPDIKRAFVWHPHQILAYFESVYRIYPTSPFTVWQDKTLPPIKHGNVSLILDGQQRIAVLASILGKEGIEINGQHRKST